MRRLMFFCWHLSSKASSRLSSPSKLSSILLWNSSGAILTPRAFCFISFFQSRYLRLWALSWLLPVGRARRQSFKFLGNFKAIFDLIHCLQNASQAGQSLLFLKKSMRSFLFGEKVTHKNFPWLIFIFRQSVYALFCGCFVQYSWTPCCVVSWTLPINVASICVRAFRFPGIFSSTLHLKSRTQTSLLFICLRQHNYSFSLTASNQW